MWSEVNQKVIDGNFQSQGDTGEGVHVKVGIGTAGNAELPVLITSTMTVTEIKEKLGLSPLADACIDAIENGSEKIYCIPVDPTSDGAVGEVSHTGTGAGSITLSGNPTNDFQVFIEIINPGNTNEGSFQYSIDGGRTYSEEMTIPLQGRHEIPDTGITISFTDAEDSPESFVSGDVYSAETTAPGTSNKKILDAVESIRYMKMEMEYVHIVGGTTEALWASLALLADEFFTSYHKPLAFVCEAVYMQEKETVEEYAHRLLESAKTVKNKYLQVVPAYAVYTRKDYRTQLVNCASIATGLYARAEVQESIGKVKNFEVSEEKLLKLMPEGIEKYLKELEDAGYLVMRQYDGRSGYYFANGRMMSPASSDYQYMEDIRVLNKIVKKVRQAALDELQGDVDPEPSELEKYVAYLKKALGAGIKECEDNKNISSYHIEILTSPDEILIHPEFDVAVSYVPMGKNRIMNLSFSVTRPQATAGEE